MTGINGIISTRLGDQLEPFVRRMIDGMVREEDEETDVIVDGLLGVGIGWRRGVDRKSEPVPIWNQTRDVCAVIYGEHFSDAAEQVFPDGEYPNPAAYLLRGYEKEGAKVLERLNGWFCGALIDLRESKIVLFNDRYGLGRLYFHQDATGFFFASQAKSLLKTLPHLRQIDGKGLAEWFTCGCVLQNRTLFRDIFLLPGGSAWTFRNGDVEKRSYFKALMWEDQPKLDVESYYLQLRQIFERVLPRYFQGNQQVAMSLTGGVDGRMIMAWSQKTPGTLPCYTFGGAYRESRDVQIARQIAKTCGQPYQTISVNDRFISEFPDLAEKAVYFTDGAMDVTGAAELYVNRKAQEVAPVRMTGNYGSEILRSNVAFRPSTPSTKIFDADLCAHAQDAATLYAEERRGNRLSFIAFKQVPWHHFGRFALERSQLIVRSPFLDNDLVGLVFQAPATMRTDNDLSYRLVTEGNPKLGRIPTDRGIAYPTNRLTNRLRHWVENFLAKAEYAYDYGMPQWLARLDHALAPLKPERLFLGRQKFCHFRVWYRDRLASYVKEILLDPRSLSRPYLKRREVEQMVADHLRGKRNFTTEIHKLLTVELVHRLLLEQR